MKQTITISEFTNGAVQDEFDAALARVVENIHDYQTDEKPREITIKFKLKD